VCNNELWDNEQAHDGLVRIFVAFYESYTAKDRFYTHNLELVLRTFDPEIVHEWEGTVTFTTWNAAPVESAVVVEPSALGTPTRPETPSNAPSIAWSTKVNVIEGLPRAMCLLVNAALA